MRRAARVLLRQGVITLTPHVFSKEQDMDLTTLQRLPLWIGGKAVSATTLRYGEVTNPAVAATFNIPCGAVAAG